MRRYALALCIATGPLSCGDDGGGSGESTTTDPSTSSTSTTDAESSSSSEDSADTSTGPPPLVPYGRCAMGTDEECLEDFMEVCIASNDTCAPACEEDADCPDAPSGTALPFCETVQGQCRISCADDLECPDGLKCASATLECFWDPL